MKKRERERERSKHAKAVRFPGKYEKEGAKVGQMATALARARRPTEVGASPSRNHSLQILGHADRVPTRNPRVPHFRRRARGRFRYNRVEERFGNVARNEKEARLRHRFTLRTDAERQRLRASRR